MYISKLEVTNIRNLQNVRLSPTSHINFIVGENGSGKTSLLEAVYLLAHGRSFRTPEFKKVVTKNEKSSIVFGRLQSGESNIALGIQKSISGNTIVKIDGKVQSKMSSIASLMPAMIIESTSLELIDSGPSIRRSVLDWGMFHVEHEFLTLWQHYKKAYRQKLALLKSRQKPFPMNELNYWNQLLAELGDKYTEFRKRYIKFLNESFLQVLSKYFKLDIPVTLQYRSGWNEDKWSSLHDCLIGNQNVEVERQACLYGPHRADLEIRWGDTLARDICSRGQKKLLLYGVRLSQIALLAELRNTETVLLLDDLPAELDHINIDRITQFLNDFPCQAFITAVNESSVRSSPLSKLENHCMFHVEHGVVSSV